MRVLCSHFLHARGPGGPCPACQAQVGLGRPGAKAGWPGHCTTSIQTRSRARALSLVPLQQVADLPASEQAFGRENTRSVFHPGPPFTAGQTAGQTAPSFHSAMSWVRGTQRKAPACSHRPCLLDGAHDFLLLAPGHGRTPCYSAPCLIIYTKVGRAPCCQGEVTPPGAPAHPSLTLQPHTKLSGGLTPNHSRVFQEGWVIRRGPHPAT